MATFRSGAAAILLASALPIAGCAAGGHHADGPAGIAYDCGGRPARVIHHGGGDPLRAGATLRYDGRIIAMRAAPAAAGLRYASEPVAGQPHVFVWTETGEQARLGEVPVDEMALSDGREVALCRRLRLAEEIPETDGPAEAGSDDH